MTQVREPKFTVKYNQKDITTVISDYLRSITYKDAVKGHCDEVEIELSNASGKWLDEWYPTFGDQLEVTMGYDDLQFPCGKFDLDEVEIKWLPDTIIIKGLSAGIKKPTRTKNSDSHENKTLRQIAQKIADRHGYTIAGTIDVGQIKRVTQNRETDLAFLKRISEEYGHVFSIRDNVMTFTDVYKLEGLQPATTIDRDDLKSEGSWIKDKSYETYAKIHVAYHNPRAKAVFETEFEFPEQANVDGYTWNEIVKKDVKEVRIKLDNVSQADAKALASLHSSNSKQQEGRLIIPGNPLMVSGNNFTLTGMGKLSGLYHIYSSEHKLTVNDGYETEVFIKRVGFIDIVKTKRKLKHRKPIPSKIVITK